MIARTCFALSVAAFAVLLVVSARVLPDRVPLHFSGSGQVDRWGDRAEAVTTMGLIGAGVALLLAAVALGMRRVPMQWLNLPNKSWWAAEAERARRARRMLEADMYVVGAATMALLVAVQVLTIRAARLPEPALDVWIWVVVGLYTVGLLAWVVRVSLVRYRPDPE